MPTFSIKRSKYFEINYDKLDSNVYCVVISHAIHDLPEYSDENLEKYQKKILLSYHKIYLTSKKNLIFNVNGELHEYLKKQFKLKPSDIESTSNIYDRNNVKIYVVIVKWNNCIKNNFNKSIQLYRFKNYITNNDIYESILDYSHKYLKERKITNDNESIITNYYNLFYKMIGLHDTSKYNLIKYINNNT